MSQEAEITKGFPYQPIRKPNLPANPLKSMRCFLLNNLFDDNITTPKYTDHFFIRTVLRPLIIQIVNPHVQDLRAVGLDSLPDLFVSADNSADKEIPIEPGGRTTPGLEVLWAIPQNHDLNQSVDALKWPDILRLLRRQAEIFWTNTGDARDDAKQKSLAAQLHSAFTTVIKNTLGDAYVDGPRLSEVFRNSEAWKDYRLRHELPGSLFPSPSLLKAPDSSLI